MYFLEMMLAFLVLLGVALFFVSVFRVNSGEGMFLTVILTTVLLLAGSIIGSFIYGIYSITILALSGVIVFFIRKFCFHEKNCVAFFSPVVTGLLLLYMASLVLYHNDFIQHIDELHHWAATVKFMLNSDRMPVGLSVSNSAYASSLFLLYFQQFTGYSEQGMYVAAFLFMWAGFLLPFSEYGWKDWKKVFIYIITIYFSMFTLYLYGTKSLYVDIPVASWAGGLVGWWMNRRKSKADYFIAVSGLVMVYFIKASSGLLLALFVLMFMILQSKIVESDFMAHKKKMKKLMIGGGVLCALVIMGSVILLGVSMKIEPVPEMNAGYEEVSAEEEGATGQEQCWMIEGIELPEAICNMINSTKLSRDKVVGTVRSFATKSIGASFSGRSNWNLAFYPFIFVILVLWKVCEDLYGDQQKYRLYMLYTGFVALCYSAVMLFSFLFMFAYELSVEMRSSARYFSTCAIFLFIPVLVELLKKDNVRKTVARRYIVLGITVFFLLGLNQKFIPYSTALDKENIPGFEKLNSMADQINKLDHIISENDKVYFLCQYSSDNLGGAELYTASAFYYLENRVSNYLETPWRFSETGCNIRLEKFDTMLSELPSLLAGGGYTYLWVHTTDKYLTEALPEVLECNKKVKSGYLYKIIYEDGIATGLRLVKNLQSD